MKIRFSDTNRCIASPIPRALLLYSVVFLCAALLPRAGEAQSPFLGVALGDSCRQVYSMEVAMGAQPALPLERMLEDRMLGFERQEGNTREAHLYNCDHNTVTSISRHAGFRTEAERQQRFQNLLHALEDRFGEPSLDMINKGLFVKLLLWSHGMNNVVDHFRIVHWDLPEGQTAYLAIDEHINQEFMFIVSTNWSAKPVVNTP